ncbi:MAG TPA: HipA family kinase [Polyangia bacterium]|nr:HipA family kinase [Polyangia bacterium]
MRTVTAVRYVTPLREGGSMPALVEGDDGALWVVKLRGAGQGTRALIAEIVVGELARALGLPVPELALVELAAPLGRAEPDPEVRELLLGSVGSNAGLAHLPAAVGFDRAAREAIPGALASRVVALDAFATNVDRTPRNPNLLWSGGRLWLIDHGAALYFHHDWNGGVEGAKRPFVLVRDHVLLPWADDLAGAGRELAARLDDATLGRALDMVPDDWFVLSPELPTPLAHRDAYRAWLQARRGATGEIMEEAARARSRL